MLLLVIGLLVIVAIILFKRSRHYEEHHCWNSRDTCTIAGTAVCVVTIGLLIIAIFTTGRIFAGEVVIDNKIAMYQEENDRIEAEVDKIVENYLQYEQETFTDLKNDSPIVLATLFPELKSDALVKEQLNIYTTNNAKIKYLKEEKIDIMSAKWWLYFGH